MMKPPKGRRRSTGQLPQASAGLFLAAGTVAAASHPEDAPPDSFPPLEGIKDQIRHMFQSVHTPGVVSSPRTRHRSGSARRSSVAGPVLFKELPPAALRGADSFSSMLNSSFDDQSLENIRVPNPAFYLRESHILERQVSYEEELERKTWTLREIAVTWKHRWMKERQERRVLSQKVVEVEQECVRVIESLREQHNLQLKTMEDELTKINRFYEDVAREKSTLESSFRQMLEQVETQKLDHEKHQLELNKTVASVKKENDRLLKALAKAESENKKLRSENNKLQETLSERSLPAPIDLVGGAPDGDMFNDHYKVLLDIAINRVRQIEESSAFIDHRRTSLNHPAVSRSGSGESRAHAPCDGGAGLGLWRTSGSDVRSWDSTSSLDSTRSDVTDKTNTFKSGTDRTLTKKLSLESWPELPETSSVATHVRHGSEPVSISTNDLLHTGSRMSSVDSESAESGYHTLVYPSNEGSDMLSHSYSEDNLVAAAADLADSADDRTKFNTISSNRKREKRSTSVGVLRDKSQKPERRARSCAGDLESDILSLSENNLLDIGKEKSGAKRPSKSNLLAKWQGLDLKVDWKKTWRQKRRNLSDLGSVFKGKSRERDSMDSVGDGESSNPGSVDLSDSECKFLDDKDKRQEENTSKNSKSMFRGLTNRRNGVAMQMVDQLYLSETVKEQRKSKGNILELLKTWKTTGSMHNGNNNNNIYKTARDQRKKFGKV